MDSTLVPLGEKAGPVANFCDPDEIAAFALAINDDNPMYQDGRAAPPTYGVVPVFPLAWSMMDIPDEAMVNGRGGGHGEHDLFIRKLITPGMVLHTTCERYSVVTSKAGMNVFLKLVSTDDTGDPVLEQFWSSIRVGEVTGGDQGGPIPDHTFPETARANLVGTMTLSTTRDQTFRYAGASGDRSIPHVNDQAAQQSGQPGKFLQGACTLGVATKALVALAADGDPRRIRRVAVRFSRYVFPQHDLDVSVYDAGMTDEGRHAYAFEVVSDGQVVLRHGLVEVEPE